MQWKVEFSSRIIIGISNTKIILFELPPCCVYPSNEIPSAHNFSSLIYSETREKSSIHMGGELLDHATTSINERALQKHFLE